MFCATACFKHLVPNWFLDIFCLMSNYERGDGLCGGDAVLKLVSNCFGGISTFQANTSASYCLCILPPPVPPLVDSCCLDYLSSVVNEQTSWFFSVFLCLQAKPRYHAAAPKCAGNQGADAPAALALKAGNQRKSSTRSQKPKPCFNQASGGEGPFSPSILITKPPPARASLG